MPGKHVRFALPSAYAPSTVIPPPSPSRSSSTSHSSYSHHYHHHGHHSARDDYHHHHTPSSLKRSNSSPVYYTHSLQIHKLLTYSHPKVDFDVRFSPSAITTSSSAYASHSSPYGHISSRILSEPAITPPVSSLTLSVPHMSPHWRIIVTPANGVFVTLSDVFAAIYYTLRTPVTESEYRAIRNPDDLKRLNKAYVERYRKVGERARDRYVGEKEKMNGVRRVDFLAGHTRFEGISVMGDGRTFVLHLK